MPNVASSSSGGVATASSFYGGGHEPDRAINGDRRGINYWADGTPDAFPDWLQINFSGTQSIGEIDVFSVQDNYTAPVEPTPAMTFTSYGLTAFQVQYWNGSAWVDVPGGNVAGNNLVWRQFTFAPVSTDRIRVLVNSAVDVWSRITEVEAWTITAAIYQISGAVTQGGAPLAGVTFNVTSGGNCTATNESGQYICTVPSNWSGTVTPVGTFTPSNRIYSNVIANTAGQNYVRNQTFFTISGTARTATGSPLVGVTITPTMHPAHPQYQVFPSVLSDGNGQYFITLPAGLAYSYVIDNAEYGTIYLIAALSGFTFNNSVPFFMAGPGDMGLNQDYTHINISSMVDPIAPTATDANGNYSVTVPAQWSGDIVPFKFDIPTTKIYLFTPPRRTYGTVGAHAMGQDYVGELK